MSANDNYLYKQFYYNQNSAANGSSLFNAVVAWLEYEKTGNLIQEGSTEEFEKSLSLRKDVVDYIEMYADDNIGITQENESFKQYINDERHCGFQQHLINMRNVTITSNASDKHIYGGQAEMVAVSRLKQRSVLVYKDNDSTYKQIGGVEYSNNLLPITLYYDEKIGHYGYLLKCDDHFTLEDFNNQIENQIYSYENDFHDTDSDIFDDNLQFMDSKGENKEEDIEKFIEYHPYWFLYSMDLLSELLLLFRLNGNTVMNCLSSKTYDTIEYFHCLQNKEKYKCYYENTFEWFDLDRKHIIKLLKENEHTKHFTTNFIKRNFSIKSSFETKKIKNKQKCYKDCNIEHIIGVFHFWLKNSYESRTLTCSEYHLLQMNFKQYSSLWSNYHQYYSIIQGHLKNIDKYEIKVRLKHIIDNQLFPYKFNYSNAFNIIRSIFKIEWSVSDAVNYGLELNNNVFNCWLYDCIQNNVNKTMYPNTENRIQLFYKHSPAVHLNWNLAKKVLKQYKLKSSDIKVSTAQMWKDIKQKWIKPVDKNLHFEIDYHYLLNRIDLLKSTDKKQIFIHSWICNEIPKNYEINYYKCFCAEIDRCIKQKQMNCLEYQYLNSDKKDIATKNNFIRMIKRKKKKYSELDKISENLIIETYQFFQNQQELSHGENEICLKFVKYFNEKQTDLFEEIEIAHEFINTERQMVNESEGDEEIEKMAKSNIQTALKALNSKNMLVMYQARIYFTEFIYEHYMDIDWYEEKIETLYKRCKKIIYNKLEFNDKKSKLYIKINDKISQNLTRYMCGHCGILCKKNKNSFKYEIPTHPNKCMYAYKYFPREKKYEYIEKSGPQSYKVLLCKDCKHPEHRQKRMFMPHGKQPVELARVTSTKLLKELQLIKHNAKTKIPRNTQSTKHLYGSTNTVRQTHFDGMYSLYLNPLADLKDITASENEIIKAAQKKLLEINPLYKKYFDMGFLCWKYIEKTTAMEEKHDMVNNNTALPSLSEDYHIFLTKNQSEWLSVNELGGLLTPYPKTHVNASKLSGEDIGNAIAATAFYPDTDSIKESKYNNVFVKYDHPNTEYLRNPDLFPEGKHGFDNSVDKNKRFSRKQTNKQRILNCAPQFRLSSCYYFQSYDREIKELINYHNKIMPKYSTEHFIAMHQEVVNTLNETEAKEFADSFEQIAHKHLPYDIHGTPNYNNKIRRECNIMSEILGLCQHFQTFTGSNKWPNLISDINSESQFIKGVNASDINQHPYHLNLHFFERLNAVRPYLHGKQCIFGICIDWIRTAELQFRGWYHDHEVVWIIQPFRFWELLNNNDTGGLMLNHLSLFYNSEEINTFKDKFKIFLDKYPTHGIGNECLNITMVRIAMEGLFPIASNPKWLENNLFLNGEQNTQDLLNKNVHWAHVPGETSESLYIDKDLNYIESKVLPEIIKKSHVHDCDLRDKCRNNEKRQCSYHYPMPIWKRMTQILDDQILYSRFTEIDQTIVSYVYFFAMCMDAHTNSQLTYKLGAAQYLCKYITKGEVEALIRSSRDKYTAYQKYRCVSSPEVLNQWQKYSEHAKSRKIININLAKHRPKWIWSKKQKSSDSNFIYYDKIEHYVNRPKALEHTRLLEFWQCWQLKSESEVPKYAKRNPAICHETFYNGKKQFWVRMRRHNIPSVDYGNINKDKDEYYRRLLLCWSTYRDENKLVPDSLWSKHKEKSYFMHCIKLGLVDHKYDISHFLINIKRTKGIKTMKKMAQQFVNSPEMDPNYVGLINDVLLKYGHQLINAKDPEWKNHNNSLNEIQNILNSTDLNKITDFLLNNPIDFNLISYSFVKKHIISLCKTLTMEQRNLLEFLLNTYNPKKLKYKHAIVQAEGGLGKTYIFKLLILLKKYHYGEAKKIGSASFTANSALAFNGTTVHKLFYQNIEFNNKLKPHQKKIIKYKPDFLIDEYGFSTEAMIQNIFDLLASLFTEDLKINICIGGDICQLPSPDMNKKRNNPPYLNQTLNTFEKFTLSKNIRAEKDYQMNQILRNIYYDNSLNAKTIGILCNRECCLYHRYLHDDLLSFELKSIKDIHNLECTCNTKHQFNKTTCCLSDKTNISIMSKHKFRRETFNKIIKQLKQEDIKYKLHVCVDKSIKGGNLTNDKKKRLNEYKTENALKIPNEILLIQNETYICKENLKPDIGLVNNAPIQIIDFGKYEIEIKILRTGKYTTLTPLQMELHFKDRGFQMDWYRCQYPIDYGWNATLHRFQGDTINQAAKAIVKEFFEREMLYTLIGRYTSVDYMHFPIMDKTILTGYQGITPRVKQYLINFIQEANKNYFQYIDWYFQDETVIDHDELFINRIKNYMQSAFQ